MENKYDIIVVGGGHAGIEASYISAKRGLKVLLITLNKSEIGKMSCNPAIGGLAKGHLVKEIDVLGGLMAKAIDETMIQFRVLNTKKGSAVRSSRAQADKYKYNRWMVEFLHTQDNLKIVEDNIENLIIEKDSILGILGKNGSEYFGKKVIITTGTFLNGVMYTGEEKTYGGRLESNEVVRLSDSLENYNLKIGRLKTGTPARLNKKTINFNILQEQKGDENIIPFSFLNDNVLRNLASCYITYTNDKTHNIIKENLNRSPLYQGIIKGIGPRYCPSIEDKVVRFSDKERHQIFLEPESLETLEIYPNGISTSLPKDVQEKFIRTIVGLEEVEILKYGYAVEYDYVDPLELNKTLETKKIKNLYLAGQINGTSGYEEAGIQGLIAGINAGNDLLGDNQLILQRYEAYAGVLIDDLTTKGTLEPYRMFTSRAEHRLVLREDNADFRLFNYSKEFKLLNDQEIEKYEEKFKTTNKLKIYFNKIDFYPTNKNIEFLEKNELPIITKHQKLSDYIKMQDVDFEVIVIIINYLEMSNEFDEIIININQNLIKNIFKYIENEIKLTGYIEREEIKIKKLKNLQHHAIPVDFDITSVTHLTREIREKMIKYKPKNMLEASQISGITPAAIDTIMLFLKKFKDGK